MNAKLARPALTPTELELVVAQAWGLDPEPFESVVTTCFGQAVQLVDADGFWTARIDFEHLGYGACQLNWAQTFHCNPFVEWVYRSSVIERIQTHIDVKPMFALAAYLDNLSLPPGEDEIAPAMLEWASMVIAEARVTRRPHIITGAKALFQWGVESLLPGFSEVDLDTLDTSYKRRYGIATTLLDADKGPFTASELIRIERALQGEPSWYRKRALFYLCRDWGVRPIQLALLRVEDLGEDAAGPYIWIPSVKGIRRSRLRRSRKNLKKRYLSDEAAEALSQHVESNVSDTRQVKLKFAKDTSATVAEVEALPLPLFPAPKPASRNRRFYSDPALRPYSLHADSSLISCEISAWRDELMLPSLRCGQKNEHQAPLMEFSAYRFRRTKATSMVLSGHSPEDVAEALDHQGLDSVQHYFQFNLELIDFVNAAHNASLEIKEAVAFWSGRISSTSSPAMPEDMRVANLGICKSGEVCPHHPTVTCYSCPNFRPYREADHEASQRSIEDLRNRVREHGTGPVRAQIDAALSGVRAVIEAIANDAD